MTNTVYKEFDTPKIPEHLIPSKEEIYKFKSRQYEDVTFYNTFGIDECPDLLAWLEDNLNLTSDYTVHFQFLYKQVPVHRDMGRDTVYNYLFKTGSEGAPVYTNFYVENEDGVLNKTHQFEIPCYKWHSLKTKCLHDVSYIPGTRMALTIWKLPGAPGNNEFVLKEPW